MIRTRMEHSISIPFFLYDIIFFRLQKYELCIINFELIILCTRILNRIYKAN
jgi:hypothetical protein